MIVGPDLHRESECEAILRSLPSWFGIEESLKMYARDSGTLPTFAYESKAKLMGFITLKEHFLEAWEVHCIAVSAASRNTGIGTHLMTHAEWWLLKRGVRFLQVKTIADSVPDEGYAHTRAFYLGRGYTPVEVFPTIWAPGNPALQLVKCLPHP